MKQLRLLLLECGLTEQIKWGVPCYTYNGKNVILLSAFKEYCSLNFFKGVLLNDEHNLLDKPGENSQSARLLKFTDVKRVMELEDHIKAFIFETIDIEKKGLKVEFKESHDDMMPEELEAKLNGLPSLNEAFHNLTPGRQRSYYIHISSAKQPQTRISRVEKCIPKIMEGKGFNER